MGAWATAAWDNDGAADWFGDMFDATGLANYVRETLQCNVEEHTAEAVRAAAFMVVALGRAYIWPIDDLDNDLALAISKLEEIKALDIYQEAPDIVEVIDEEIAVLKSRLKMPGD